MEEIVLIPTKSRIPGLIWTIGASGEEEIVLVYSSRKRVKLFNVVEGRCRFESGCLKYIPYKDEYYPASAVERLLRDNNHKRIG